jgi:hypothetical protein
VRLTDTGLAHAPLFGISGIMIERKSSFRVGRDREAKARIEDRA